MFRTMTLFPAKRNVIFKRRNIWQTFIEQRLSVTGKLHSGEYRALSMNAEEPAYDRPWSRSGTAKEPGNLYSMHNVGNWYIAGLEALRDMVGADS